jgi:Family of unknown function (DUF5996)
VSGPAIWPDLGVQSWAPTKKSLHLYAQMLGKLRVALSPPQPNWMFTALLLTARGVTTGPMPWHGRSIQASLDVFASELTLDRSDGERQRIALVPARPIAEIWSNLHAALAALGVNVTLSPVPQEIPDVTPFDRDLRPAIYEPAAVVRWFAAYAATADVFEVWCAHFFGRSGIQLWWGALDVGLQLFSGKKVPPPTDRGYLLRYDLDAEMMNVGLYPGDDANAPFFYGYIYPQPENAPQLPIAPAGAAWNDQLKEWVLPYDGVRASADPAATLVAFLDSIYALCLSNAGWDREALSYEAPKRAKLH